MFNKGGPEILQEMIGHWVDIHEIEQCEEDANLCRSENILLFWRIPTQRLKIRYTVHYFEALHNGRRYVLRASYTNSTLFREYVFMQDCAKAKNSQVLCIKLEWSSTQLSLLWLFLTVECNSSISWRPERAGIH